LYIVRRETGENFYTVKSAQRYFGEFRCTLFTV